MRGREIAKTKVETVFVDTLYIGNMLKLLFGPYKRKMTSPTGCPQKLFPLFFFSFSQLPKLSQYKNWTFFCSPIHVDCKNALILFLGSKIG